MTESERPPVDPQTWAERNGWGPGSIRDEWNDWPERPPVDPLREALERCDTRVATWRQWEEVSAVEKDWPMADRWRYMATGADDALGIIRAALASPAAPRTEGLDATAEAVIRDVRERLGRTVRHKINPSFTSLCDVDEEVWPCDVERLRRILALIDLRPVVWYGETES